MSRQAHEISSWFAQVQKRAQQLLANRRREIRSKDNELHRLKEEEAKLAGWLGPNSDRSRQSNSIKRQW